MGRLQQTKSGKKSQIRPINQEEIRRALNAAIDARNLPRLRKNKPSPPPA
jgi:hypothetical protein